MLILYPLSKNEGRHRGLEEEKGWCRPHNGGWYVCTGSRISAKRIGLAWYGVSRLPIHCYIYNFDANRIQNINIFIYFLFHCKETLYTILTGSQYPCGNWRYQIQLDAIRAARKKKAETA